MFSRFFATVIVTLPMVALAAPTVPAHDPKSDPHHEHHEQGGQCNVGELSCCNQVQSISGTNGANAAGLVGLAANLLPLIGLNCDPIPILGVSGNSCAAQPVCCQQNSFPGLINLLNCAPININL